MLAKFPPPPPNSRKDAEVLPITPPVAAHLAHQQHVALDTSPQMWLSMLLTIIFIISGFFVMLLFQGKSRFPVAGLTVIVTGGSQGLGLSVAKEFAKKGANVVIVAQDKGKLEAAIKIIEACQANTKQRFLQLSFDLRSADSAPQIMKRVTQWNEGSPADIVFNCAGSCSPGFFAASSLDTHRLQMDTVYWTSAYMAHAVINSWIKPANGSVKPTRHLIFTSSVVALFPLAGYAPYTPGKAAMRAMADTLDQEVTVYNGARAKGSEDAPAADIKIHIAFPMGILTPGFENEEKIKPALTRKLEEDDKPQQPDDLAKLLMAGLERDEYMITSSLIGNIMRGWALGSSRRNGLLDIFWNFLGSLVIIFIGANFRSKCRNWGREKGMAAAR